MAAASFDRFYAETYGALAGYALSLVGERAAADDLAQEAMVRVYVRWPLLRDARPYAFRIVTNLARDLWRRKQTERLALRDVAGEHAAPPDVTVLDAVERLPAGLRDLVLLHYYADLPVEAVARAVRRPAGTVKRQLSEARARLSRTLA
ncbi:MAG TPA: sigma-70 family RNA polymerase sigma factor [Mycobacteriales bacterium]|nr:sigma-70 family RNA polymerase sigma factor [Mycobacteriales bacterium]